MGDLVIGIPARLDSKRFPGKLLADLGGKPLLWHTWTKASNAFGVQNAVICSSDDPILLMMERYGAKTFKTIGTYRNGTERVHELAKETGATEVLNIQGDDPTISESVLLDLAEFDANGRHVSTPIYRIRDSALASNPNVVKVVTNESSEAMYFSRAVIPYLQMGDDFRIWGHVGVYKYTKEALSKYASRGPSDNEQLEGLEQLRFLDSRIPIMTLGVDFEPSAIDSPEDLQKLRRVL